MKRTLIILPFVILAFILSGCEPAQEEVNETKATVYLGGEKGLEINFLDNVPPSTVYDKPDGGSENPFDVGVRIKNEGEYTVEGGKYKLTITGIEPTSFKKTASDFTGLTSTESLVAKRKSGGETIDGTFTILTIGGLAYQYPVTGSISLGPIRGSLCYEYQTEASSSVCILKDLLGTTGAEPLCKATESKKVGSSGAPVAVTKLEQSVTGKDNIAFTFNVEHIGGDKNTVFQNTDQTCVEGDMTKQNKIGVKVLFGNTDITSSCSGVINGIATIYEKTGAQVRCTQTLGADRVDHVQPVKIILKYDYLQYIDQPITVKQVGS